VSELQKLTSWTCLCVRCVSGGLERVIGFVKDIAAVTQLQSLYLNTDCPDLDVPHHLPLTSLTALTGLVCNWDSGDWAIYSTQVNMRPLMFGCGWGGGYKWILSPGGIVHTWMN
jgi:hypothetical protein